MLDKSINVAERVKSLRTTLGLSQEELARELHVSFATINRWENSQTTPSKLAWAQFERFRQERRGELS